MTPASKSSKGAAARAGPAALLVAGWLWAGCGYNDDLAALVVSSVPDAGAFDPSRSFIVIGQLWLGMRPQLVATWPLATPLREFFAGGMRVVVPEADREALWTLRAAVAAGQYGGPRAGVVAVDASGEAYSIVFPGGE